MGCYGNGCLNFAYDLGVNFLGVPNWEMDGFFKKLCF